EADPFLESMIVTCQALRLSADGGIRIASAGHPPPLLVTPAGCRSIDVAGPLPGLISKGHAYETATLHLAKDEMIVFGTDGFYSAFDPASPDRPMLCDLLRTSMLSKDGNVAPYIWQDCLRRRQDTAADNP